MKNAAGGLASDTARRRLVDAIAKREKINPDVLDAMEHIPRHAFVDPGLASRAYNDTVLPIGFEQTISQPTVVAIMSSAVIAQGNRSSVLEIGTGCGYQTAILALLFDHVYTVERIRPLQANAIENLDGLGIRNVSYHLADGHWGWPEKAPFDAVLCAAAFHETPEELKNQVTSHGRLVFPLDIPSLDHQYLMQLDRDEEDWIETNLASVRFVPMKSGIRQ